MEVQKNNYLPIRLDPIQDEQLQKAFNQYEGRYNRISTAVNIIYDSINHANQRETSKGRNVDWHYKKIRTDALSLKVKIASHKLDQKGKEVRQSIRKISKENPSLGEIYQKHYDISTLAGYKKIAKEINKTVRLTHALPSYTRQFVKSMNQSLEIANRQIVEWDLNPEKK